ncbi:MAG: DUF2231 domain-containing protein [Candidatus Competibacteraceae bacterium]|nr:DUF2231 domain-containing protein [Candidatus Competibacteraceae bacterium]
MGIRKDYAYARAPSRVALFQHPIHPMVVVFPIAFLYGALAADLAYWWFVDPFWARMAFWLIAAGLTVGLAAALIGMGDFFSIREIRQHVSGWSHFLSGVMVLSLAAANLQLRWEAPVATVLPLGLFLSAVTGVMLMITGWLGGTLTFRHSIGTYGKDTEQEVVKGHSIAPPKD